jgi:hypothetical protein
MSVRNLAQFRSEPTPNEARKTQSAQRLSYVLDDQGCGSIPSRGGERQKEKERFTFYPQRPHRQPSPPSLQRNR